jgi:hypothetical protein
VVYPIIYRVSTIQGGAGFLPSTVLMLMSNIRGVNIQRRCGKTMKGNGESLGQFCPGG